MPASRKQVRPSPPPTAVSIRRVTREDLPAVIALDELNTGLAKPDYWRDLFERYTQRNRPRHFLVADKDGQFLGFIIGEVRAWEFGSEPCGWVFAIGVDPKARVQSVGAQLLDAVCAQFKRAGVAKVRTMLARNNNLIMSFFRSQGLMAGPFIQLEKDI